MAKPIVDGIERDLEGREGRARVVRLNVSSEQGHEDAQRYGVRGVPTTVVIGRDGEVIERHAGIPSREKVVAQAAAGHAVEG